MTAAQAVAAALLARARGTIGGHHVELSMLDASLAFLWPDVFWNHGFVGDEGVTKKPLIADFYRLLPTTDGYVTLMVVGDEEFKSACAGLGLTAPLSDPRFRSLSDRFENFADLFVEFEKGTSKLSTAELVARMDRAGVPCAKVNSLDEVVDDPRVNHRSSIVEYDHPQAGRVRQARAAAIFDGEPLAIRSASPTLGQHTDELLASVGCSASDLAALRAAGAIA